MRQSQIKYNTLYESQKFTGQKKFTLATYAIYVSLSDLGIPRSIDEICFFSGARPNAVWGLQKEFSGASDTTENYVERVCSELDMKFSDISAIKIIVQNMCGDCGVKTQTLLASVIYLQVKVCGKLKLKDICRTCKVTPSSVHKFVNRIAPKFRNNISLLI